MLTTDGYRRKISPPNPALSPLSIARMIWKRKLSAGILAGALGLIGCLVVHRLPAIYSSEALILVDSQKIPEKLVASTVSTDLQDRIQTISEQILSSGQLKKVIEDFDLYHAERKNLFEEEILEKMRKDISVKLEQGWTGNRPGAFRVSFQGPNPAVVAQVTNRLANLYIDENLKTREVQAEGTSEFISTQLQVAKRKLDELEAAVSKYKLAHNGELPQQENALIGTLSRLQAELEANRDAINRSEQAKLVLDNTLNTLESTASILARPDQQSSARGGPTNGPVSAAAEVPETKPKSEVLQAQLDLVRLRYSEDHPDVKRLRDEIARLKEAEKKEVEKKEAARLAPHTDASNALNATASLPPRPERERPELLQARERINMVKAQMVQVNRDLEFRKSEQQRVLRDMAQYQERIGRLRSARHGAISGTDRQAPGAGAGDGSTDARLRDLQSQLPVFAGQGAFRGDVHGHGTAPEIGTLHGAGSGAHTREADQAQSAASLYVELGGRAGDRPGFRSGARVQTGRAAGRVGAAKGSDGTGAPSLYQNLFNG